MKPDPIYRARLMVLADHLRHSRRSQVFDFGIIHGRTDRPLQDILALNQLRAEDHVNPRPHECGTIGCAIGEMPYCWPKDAAFARTSYNNWFVVLNDRPQDPCSSRNESFLSAESWFGLEEEEADHLFAPEDQDIAQYGGRELGYSATPVEVADNILAFCDFQVIHYDLPPVPEELYHQELQRAKRDQAEILERPQAQPQA